MRVHELAKELGVDSKEFIKRLREMNFSLKSHLSVIDKDTADIIRGEFKDLKEKKIQENSIEVDFPLTVKNFAVKVNKKPSEIIMLLLKKGKRLSINQNIDKDLSIELGRSMGFNLREKSLLEEKLVFKQGPSSANLKPRPPVVTLMGHIDHGKTSILDYIRKSRITDRESGGITQHIGAYQVDTGKGRITFVDTPGHETFTAMRSRGADITDIVILVVAADEGVKPQTEEAVSHAKAAGVPIIVALNKIDRENVQTDMVKQQLSKLGLTPEDWGGKTIVVPVSAKTGKGIDDLLDMLLLEAELLELKADFDRPALGVVIESRLSKGLGPVSSVIVQQGVLKIKDTVVCGKIWGKVKVLRNDKGADLKEAFPSECIEIVGLQGIPSAGDNFFVVPSEKQAREITGRKISGSRQDGSSPVQHIRIEDLYKKMKENKLKQFRVIIKADAYGTLEAISDILNRIDLKEVSINILHKGVGAVNLSDVVLAEASDALIVGFKTGVEPAASKQSKDKGIQIKTYQVIYELVSDIKAAIEGLLKPVVKRIFLGRAKVKKVFRLSKFGIIAGSIVEKGKLQRNILCRLLRGKDEVFKGKIHSLKRFKEDVKEVGEGVECGIGISYNGVQVDDIIEGFKEESTARRIDV